VIEASDRRASFDLTQDKLGSRPALTPYQEMLKAAGRDPLASATPPDGCVESFAPTLAGGGSIGFSAAVVSKCDAHEAGCSRIFAKSEK